MPDYTRELEESIQDYVTDFLPTVGSQRTVRADKIIHDAVWGTHVFTAPEIAVIDTPLIQRLRGVHQTSFAYLTYPAAHHSRFEHSLGVAVMSSKLLTALDEPKNTKEAASVRLAALLHDCGHGFLSHISERRYKNHHWIEHYRTTDTDVEKPKAHELLSYLIVSSARFGQFFDELVTTYKDQYPYLSSVNIREVAGLIIGKAWHHDKKYLADIINGPFDADKLDYLNRDAYFTGLSLSIDIDRLLFSTTVQNVDQRWLETKSKRLAVNEADRKTASSEECPKSLVLRSGGSNALEQILFSKMQLTASIYQHHKVRAADAMLTSYLEYVSDNGLANQPVKPTDFLRSTDWEWLYQYADDPYLSQLLTQLRNRDLFKRVLVISRGSIDEGHGEIVRFQKAETRDAKLLELRHEMIQRLNTKKSDHGLKVYDIVIDLPPQPSFREAEQTPIRLANGSLDTLNNFFPTDDWLSSFYINKWRAHVFCGDCGHDTRLCVAQIAKEVIEEKLGIRFNDSAFSFANIPPHEVPT